MSRSYPPTLGRGHAYLKNMASYLDEIWDVLPALGVGQTWYVNTVLGSAGYNGKRPSQSFLTMAQAFAKVSDNDVIAVIGDVREQILAPLGMQGVRIIGVAGGNTRHDDGVRWREPAAPTPTTPLLTLREQGWEVHNILFVPGTGNPAIRLRRAEDATYPDGSHAIITRCKFVSDAGCAIEDHGGCSHVIVAENEFDGGGGLTNLPEGIKNVVGAGIASPLRWDIRDNWFNKVEKAVVLPGNQCRVRRNIFTLPFAGAYKTVDTSGGTEGKNWVQDNKFADAIGDYLIAKGYVPGVSDVWRNQVTDTAADIVAVPV